MSHTRDFQKIPNESSRAQYLSSDPWRDIRKEKTQCKERSCAKKGLGQIRIRSLHEDVALRQKLAYYRKHHEWHNSNPTIQQRLYYLTDQQLSHKANPPGPLGSPRDKALALWVGNYIWIGLEKVGVGMLLCLGKYRDGISSGLNFSNNM